jgi:protein-L-isoaspartate(D-aspartate) O-methyltransferase
MSAVTPPAETPPTVAAALQAALIKHLQDTGSLTRPEVAAAFLAVPRDLFLPNLPLDEVYRDEAIPTKMEGGHAISSSSQPAIMAIMLEQLEVSPGQRVLEIGAGTGYNAALLGQLVGARGRVIAVDIDDDIVEAARLHLAAAGAQNVEVVRGDGAEGFAEGGPYDRIILTVGAWDIAPAWREQLRAGGRLVLPLGVGAGPQKCVAFLKTETAGGPWLVSETVRDCGFMRLRGRFAGPERMVGLGTEPGLSIALAGELPVPAVTVLEWLSSRGVEYPVAVRVTNSEVWGGLSLWLALNAPDLCALIAEGDWATRGLPCLVVFASRHTICSTLGLVAPSGAAFLRRLPQPDPGAKSDDEAPFELHVGGYGPDGGAETARALMAHLSAWQAARRPGSANLRLRVYSPEPLRAAQPGEIVVHKEASQVVIDWPNAR